MDVCIVCGIPWKDGVGFIGKHIAPCANDRYGWNLTKSKATEPMSKEDIKHRRLEGLELNYHHQWADRMWSDPLWRKPGEVMYEPSLIEGR